MALLPKYSLSRDACFNAEAWLNDVSHELFRVLLHQITVAAFPDDCATCWNIHSSRARLYQSLTAAQRFEALVKFFSSKP